VLPLLALLACNSDYEVIPGPVDVDPGTITECDFTAVDGPWYEYDCNPVFTTTGEAWAPTIGSTTFTVAPVAGHPFYQLWYVGIPSEDETEDYALGYAISAEGTDWTPHPGNPLMEHPGGGAWDKSGMDALQVIWDPGTDQYLMLYQGYNLDSSDWGLGVATSTDGRTWSRFPQNPVLDLTTGKGDVVGWCWPLGLEMGQVAGYQGYIAGYRSANGPCEVFGLGGSSIGDWRPSDDLVLKAGDDGEWDDQGAISLAIAELEGERHLFYVGFGDWEDFGTYRTTRGQYLGHAVEEGGRWVRDGEPVPIHRTDDGLVSAVAAHTVGDRIHVWVTDDYDGVSAVGYFLYDPHREEAQ
jgi:hypothetical protein